MTTLPPAEHRAAFVRLLLEWYCPDARPMPWKGERNPYYIWLSEIILQQTQVAQGWAYYEAFKAAYPRIEDLAAAPEDEVMKRWAGLGYYSRARHLHATARHIAGPLRGRFPDTYEGIRALGGVGDYTAAAIASFAYGLPHAVVDGNVLRVLARVFGIAEPIDSTAGKKQFAALAQALLPAAEAARYNQAIMDFGATQCRPKQPACGTCPLAGHCLARQRGQVEALPLKAKRLQKRQRYFAYLLLWQDGEVFVEKRHDKDIWQHLYQFPLLEYAEGLPDAAALRAADWWAHYLGPGADLPRLSPPYRQALTHQHIAAVFAELELPSGMDTRALRRDYEALPSAALKNLAFPKIIDQFLKEKSLYLSLF